MGISHLLGRGAPELTGSGVSLDRTLSCIRTLRAHPAFGGLVLTEINPPHDPAGRELARLVEGLAAVLAA